MRKKSDSVPTLFLTQDNHDLGWNTGLRNWANFIAFWLVERTLAFRAFLRVDHKCITLHRDCRVGTLEFANAAAGALGSDNFVGHVHLLLRTRRRACYEVLALCRPFLAWVRRQHARTASQFAT